MDDFGGIGRGRRNDSESSSRESSPRPGGRKRSFSPPSDDDTVLPPIACDDTPPPPDRERPLIRQAVAFQAPSEVIGIVTYQATPKKTTPNPMFLPGQAVISKPKRARKSKRSEQFTAHTGRFRLPAYDPAPSADPVLDQGKGPYSAMGSAAGPDNPPALPTGSMTATTSHPIPAKQKLSGNKKKTVSNVKASTSRSVASTSARSGTVASTASDQSASTELNFVEVTTPASIGASRGTTRAGSTGMSYYRRDYDKETSTETSKHGDECSGRSIAISHPSNHKSHAESSIEQDSGRERRQPKIPLRIVTILITDNRNGDEELQLAEVRIPLRLADDPSFGYWADAKELSQELQSSPSRIDGPAKVSTMRGKYRQFFLRVSTDNKDEFVSANLNVLPDRTLEVQVDQLHPPGRVPPPPIPRKPHLLDMEYKRESHHQNPGRGEISRYSPSTKSGTQSRKHRLSPSISDYDNPSENDRSKKLRTISSSTARSTTHDDSPRTSHTALSPQFLAENSLRSTPVFDEGSNYDDEDEYDDDPSQPPSFYVMKRGYDSPTPDDDAEEVQKCITKAIDHILTQDPAWAEFFRAKAGTQVSSYLKQYEYVQKVMGKYVGQLAPFKSSKWMIEKKHILDALHIEEGERYISDCNETLRLVKLYGKGGSRHEDSRVVGMMENKSAPEFHANPIKRFLHLLCEVDENWKKEHGNETCDSDLD